MSVHHVATVMMAHRRAHHAVMVMHMRAHPIHGAPMHAAVAHPVAMHVLRRSGKDGENRSRGRDNQSKFFHETSMDENIVAHFARRTSDPYAIGSALPCRSGICCTAIVLTTHMV